MIVAVPPPLRFFTLVGLFFAAWVGTADASSVVKLSLLDQAVGADAILVGRIAEQKAGPVQGVGIVTHHRFEDVVWIKGGNGGDEFVLQECGGRLGEETVVLMGGPEFEVGGRYVVFVDQHLAACRPIAGGWQGFFQVIEGPAGETAVADGEGRLVLRFSNGIVQPRPYFSRLPPPEFRQVVSPAQGRSLSLDEFVQRIAAQADAGDDVQPRPIPEVSFGDFVPLEER